MLALYPLEGLPLVQPGDSLVDLLCQAGGEHDRLQDGDILVLAQKIVSKAEGRLIPLHTVEPSPQAVALAIEVGKDPRLVHLILDEARLVIRTRPGLIVVEDIRGFICANAGIDRSNIEQGNDGEVVALLPENPDASARALREGIRERTGATVAVLINDSHGRAFREGTVGVTIGLAGIPAVWDRRGDADLTGYHLEHTEIGIADEVAAAASLLMGPAAEGIPAVVVRGLQLPEIDGRAADLQRPAERDLFR